jgi:alpha-beta hydrolase superfamily lysophospholipase
LNEKERGHARSETRLVNDQLHFLRHVRDRRNNEAPAVPVALLGLSWGGKLAAAVTAQAPELVDGLILLYPGIKTLIRASVWQNFKLSLARSFDVLYKRIPIPLEDPRLFTSDEKWQQFIRTDEMTLRDVTVAFLLASRELDELANQAASRIRCPTLLMLSAKDQIIDNIATKEWFKSLASQEQALFEYADSAHTLEFESCRDQYISDLTDWLEKLCQVT